MKTKKAKPAKNSKRAAAGQDPELPSLVTAMSKFVERLEGLERKMDQVLGRVSNLPFEIKNAVQNSSRPDYNRNVSAPNSNEPRREQRPLYQAVCADCRKNCEVPFKPGDRPVYCKECFTLRKSGHTPQDPDSRSRAVSSSKYMPSVPTFTAPSSGNVGLSRRGKQKISQTRSKKRR